MSDVEHQLASRQWLEPWEPIAEAGRGAPEAELARELPPGHALCGRTARALARRCDCDDVLFALDDGSVAVVHLTYSVETDVRWPSTEIYRSLEDFAERRMDPDHHELTE